MDTEIKTINELLLEKRELETEIESMVNVFLRNNPDVLDVEILKSTFSYETKCQTIKEITVGIKLIM